MDYRPLSFMYAVAGCGEKPTVLAIFTTKLHAECYLADNKDKYCCLNISYVPIDPPVNRHEYQSPISRSYSDKNTSPKSAPPY